MTQSQLAVALGLPQPRVAEVESGKRELRALELLAALDALGVSLRTFERRWRRGPVDNVDVE